MFGLECIYADAFISKHVTHQMMRDYHQAAIEADNAWRLSQYAKWVNTHPCPYCKRTNQTNGHKSCDGCGAPR